MSRIGSFARTAAMVVLLSAGVAASALAQTDKQSGTLRVGVPENFSGFNPFEDVGRLDYNVLVNVFDTLTIYGPDYVPQPMLATGWERVDDTTWRFDLRPDVVFHDGTPFDAEAAKFSLDRMMESSFGEQFEPVQSVAVTGPHAIEIKTSAPFPTLLAQLTQPYAAMVPPRAFEAKGADFAREPVGTGPFALESWDGRSELVLKRNDAYWREDGDGAAYPYLDNVVWQVLPDPETAALALQNGDVDFLYKVPLPFLQILAANPETKVLEAPSLGWEFIMLHVEKPPFDDAHARRAVQLALDRQAIVDTVQFGYAVPALGPIALGSWAYDPAIETEGLYGAEPSPEAVQTELEAAGMADGFAFDLVYPTQAPFDAMAQVVKAQLEPFGIEANLNGKEIGAALDDLFASNFEALMIDWSGRIDEALTFPSFFVTSGFSNFGKYSNPEVDELVREAGRIADVGARAELYQEAQAKIVEDSPLIWITVPTDRKAARAAVEGYTNLGDQRMRFYDVWIEG